MTTRNFGARSHARGRPAAERPGAVRRRRRASRHAARRFLRSNVAHARIRSIDVSAARARAGVVAVYTADDLGDTGRRARVRAAAADQDITFNQRTQVPLAKDKIRHVGEPLAVVLAESRYLAEDALADIAVELEPLPAVVDLENALTDESARVHDDVRGNVAARVRQSRGNYAAAQLVPIT